MANTDKIPLTDFYNSRFQVGQVWEYQSRLTDPKSTLRILKVEKLYETEIAIHIQVNGLNLKSAPEEKDSGIASHLPFSEEAVEASVTLLITENAALPDDFEEGYEMWLEAFLEGKAGVFSGSVESVLNMIDETMSEENRSK